MARTRRLHRSGSSNLRSPTLKRHPNLKALRLRLVAVRQPFGPFRTACRRKRRWTCSSKARHPRRLRTRQQIRPKSRREWCSSNTRLLNRSRRARRCQKRGRALASALACGSLVTSNVKVKLRSSAESKASCGAQIFLISDGAQIEGSIIAQNVTVCGRVKGTIRAVRVRLQNGGAVEGDIFHRSLSIDENSQFEGSSRWVENPIDSSSSVDLKGPQEEDMQNPAPTPLPSIDAELRRVERWFAHSCAQMASQPESPAMR
jgi:cytoskeletal protein CcmA (bactofilin family)